MSKNGTLTNPTTFTSAILAALPDGVIVVNRGNQILYANEAAHTLLHSEDNTLAGTQFNFRVRLSSPQEIKLHVNNRLVVLEAKATQVMFNSQKSILVSVRDITAHIRKKAEENKPVFTEAKKDEFLFVASHELKTPLTCLKAYNELVRFAIAEKDFKGAHEYAEKVNMFVNRLTNITNDLLDTSHMQSEKLVMQLQLISPRQAVKDSLENLRPIFPSHKIIFKGNATNKILGDRVRLDQVLTNLVSNAVKFSPGKDKIVVEMADNGKMLMIRVKDFGIGISHENIESLASRFYRESAVQNKFEGLGLGLFIASQILKGHGGKLMVESSEGKGSIFSYTIPIAEG